MRAAAWTRVIGTCARMCLLTALLTMSSGCAREMVPTSLDAAAEDGLARSTACEIVGLLSCNEALGDADVNRLCAYVRDRIAGGNVAGMASLVNVHGPWQRSSWYREFANVFASAFRQERPIVLDGAPAALRALHTLAVAGTTPRNTAVNAAAAIRFEYPDLARKVLMREYARFEVSDSWVLGKPGLPEPCGRVLVSIGVCAPEELVCVEDVAEMLRRVGIIIDADDQAIRRLLVRTGNQYNALLMDAMAKSDRGLLSWLAARDAQSEKVAEIYRGIVAKGADK
jgi:hypothetical protein